MNWRYCVNKIKLDGILLVVIRIINYLFNYNLNQNFKNEKNYRNQSLDGKQKCAFY